MSILPASYMSLFLGVRHNGREISVATGFVTNTLQDSPVLITNRHVVTGRHQDTGDCLDQKHQSEPTELVISHNYQGKLGKWIRMSEPLYDSNGKPLWYEHPILGEYADIIGLPLTQLKDIDLFPYDINKSPALQSPKPSDRLSVVGFPYGLSTGGGYAIWTTGFLASEPEVDKPNFLIDCRARQGQSGSPVIAHSNGGAVMAEDGGIKIGNQVITDFLGVYSGRTRTDSDIGKVWKAKVVLELINAIK